MQKLKQASGNWVDGEKFWDRESEMELFMEKIQEGAHILLIAQRRMGKTSLMHEVARRLEDRYACLFVDLQKAASASDAMVELSVATKKYKSLYSKITGLFSNVITAITGKVEEISLGEVGFKLRAGLTAGNWAEKGDQIFAILATSDKPVLLLIDEIPIMVTRMLKGEDFIITPERKAAVNEFMSWLRKNSLHYQRKVSIVLSGSIGLEPVLHQADLSSTINNFYPFELKPWDKATASGCLEALANEYGVKFQAGATAAMADKLGCCIPHHVQMFFSKVYETCKRRGRMEFAPKEVKEIYQTEMLSTRGHAELTHYEERLKLVLGQPILTLALEMLTEAAVCGRLTCEALAAFQKNYDFAPQSVEAVEQEILRVLEHDGYLRKKGRVYVFESNLLRDWWKERHQSFYTPILKRGQ